MVLEGRQPLIVGISVALMVASTLSVPLRFWSRRIMNAGYW